MHIVKGEDVPDTPLKYPLALYRTIGIATVNTKVKAGSLEFMAMINQAGVLDWSVGNDNPIKTQAMIDEITAMITLDDANDPRMMAFMSGALSAM